MRVRQHFPRRLTSRAAALSLFAFAALTTFACNLDKLTQPPLSLQEQVQAAVNGDTTVSMGATTSPLTITTAKGALDNSAVVIYSSDKPLIASVNPTTGVVTGIALGIAKISATVSVPGLGEVQATTHNVRVKYAKISIKPVDSLIAIGQTKPLDVRGLNPAGVVLASIPFVATTMTIVSRDPTIFDVDATTGQLVAKKNGSALVFVQFDGLKDSVTVKVRQVTRAMTYVGTVGGQLPVGSLNKDRTIGITAADSLGVAITAPTITWATSDLTTMTIVAATGVARALKLGTVTITATSDGFQKTVVANITQVPATLTKTAATDGLSATVNTAVTLAPEVTVVDSGNTPIPSVGVTFTVVTGGGTITGGTPTSAATGKAAATSWQLGTVAGANTVLASAGNASATFSATGTAGLPKKLGFSVQPVNAAIGAVIAPAIKVTVLDSLDNPTTATNSVTIAVGSGPAATLGGTLTAAAVAGVATFSNVTLSASGSFTLVATSGGLLSATSNSFGIFGAAAKLGVVTQPIGGTAGQVLQPVRIAIQDAGGNTVTSDTRSITIAITAATGTPGAVLGGTLTATAVAGVATFSTLTVDRAGTAYKLTGTTTVASALTAATSNTFDIIAVGPAAKLAFTVQPTTTVAGASITPNVQVTVQDAGGATVTASTAAITLAIETNPGSGTLGGTTLTVNATAGVATFTGISINKVGTAYKLNATSGTLTKAVSSAFNITAGAATKVGFLVNPSNAVAGAVIAPSIQIAIQDASGNTVASTANVTLTIGAGPGGSALGGTVTQAAVAGVATFNNITLTPAATSYQLTASSPSITSATSPVFTITASATSAIKLGFLTQPTNVASSTAIAPSIQVAVQDANGATVTSSSSPIALQLTSNAGGAVASGTLSVNASSGVATFTNVQVALAGTGYTLSATSAAAGFTPATSAAFNVTAGAAHHLLFTTQPAAEVAGTPFTQDLQVTVVDAAGNTVTNATNVVTLGFNNNPGNSQLRGTTSVAAVAGIATFPGVRLTKVGTGYTLFASSTSLNGVTSTSFDVTAAPASALAFKTAPTNAIAGAFQPSPFIQVAVVDSLGNTITTATDQISLTANTFPNGGAMIGTSPVSAVAGIATFSDVKFNVSGSYTLAASATNLATVNSNGFFISAGPAASLKWNVNPQATGTIKNGPITASNGATLEVDVVDAQGNQVFSDNSTSVTVTIGTGTGPLTGTVTKVATVGAIAFNDLVINNTGTGYTLTATAGTLTGTSTAFAIAAFGTPSQWKFGQQPTSTTTQTAISPAVTALLKDAFGNTITSGANSTLTANIFISGSPLSGVGVASGSSAVASAGVATFPSLKIANSSDAVAISVSGTVGGEVSNNFNIAAAASAAGFYDITQFNNNTLVWIERNATGTLNKIDQAAGTVSAVQTGLVLNFPIAVVSDGANVYWLEDGNGAANQTFLKKISIGGGTVTSTLAMSGGGGILQLDNAGNIFFIANGTANLEIKKLSTGFIAGAAPSAFFTSTCANGSFNTCAPVFTVSASTMYYFDGTSAIKSTATTVATAGTTLLVSSIPASPHLPVSIAVSASTIFWTTGTNISTAPIGGGSATQTATNGNSIVRLGFDGTSLFALDGGGTVIRKYNSSGQSVGTLVTGVAALTRALCFDGVSVFWADNVATANLRRTSH